VRRCRDELGVLHRRRVNAGRDQAGEMRDVDHDHGADFVGRLAERLKVDLARVGAVTDHDHFRAVLARELAHRGVIDALVRAAERRKERP
jgi:hypothetical protein